MDIVKLRDFYSLKLTIKSETKEYHIGILKGKHEKNSIFHSFLFDPFIPIWINNEICRKLGYDNLHSIIYPENNEEHKTSTIFSLQSYSDKK